MIAPLLLVAIFSFELPFYAEAQGQLLPAPKCDQTLVEKIYDYWNKNGGIPQRLIEKNIKCSEREVAVLATQNFGGADLKCIVFRHFADSKIVYFVNNNNVTDILHEIVEEHSGQIYEPYDNYYYYVRGILRQICIGGEWEPGSRSLNMAEPSCHMYVPVTRRGQRKTMVPFPSQQSYLFEMAACENKTTSQL